ncbi:MAG: alpha/beta fold hydrolase [Flavobacteriales bacterium]
MKLHYRKIGQGEPLIILHGLFGYSDNWQTLGKRYAEDFEVYLVDQRNHGHSPHSLEFSYNHMADDLLKLMTDCNLSSAYILGHSMGGKTAIRFTQKNPHMVKKLIVADIGVKGYPMHHGTIIDGLKAIDLNRAKTRGEAEEMLAPYIPQVGVRQFLLKNLYWVEQGQLGWRMNLAVLDEKMVEIIGALPADGIDVPTLFLRGELSNYILEADYDAIRSQFSDCRIETIPQTGHWIHAENPELFYSLTVNFLRE